MSQCLSKPKTSPILLCWSYRFWDSNHEIIPRWKGIQFLAQAQQIQASFRIEVEGYHLVHRLPTLQHTRSYPWSYQTLDIAFTLFHWPKVRSTPHPSTLILYLLCIVSIGRYGDVFTLPSCSHFCLFHLEVLVPTLGPRLAGTVLCLKILECIKTMCIYRACTAPHPPREKKSPHCVPDAQCAQHKQIGSKLVALRSGFGVGTASSPCSWIQ